MAHTHNNPARKPAPLTEAERVSFVQDIAEELGGLVHDFQEAEEGVPFNFLTLQYLGDFRHHRSMHVTRRRGAEFITPHIKRSELPAFAGMIGDIHTLYRDGITSELPALDMQMLAKQHLDISSVIDEYHALVKNYRIWRTSTDAVVNPIEMEKSWKEMETKLREALSSEKITIPVRIGQHVCVLQNKNALGLYLFALHESRLHQIDAQKLPPHLGVFLKDVAGESKKTMYRMEDQFRHVPELARPYHKALAKYYPDILKLLLKNAHALQMAHLLDVDTSGLLSVMGLTPYPEKLESPFECAVVLGQITSRFDRDEQNSYVRRFTDECQEMKEGKRRKLNSQTIQKAAQSVVSTYNTNGRPFTYDPARKQVELVEQFMRSPWVGSATSVQKPQPRR